MHIPDIESMVHLYKHVYVSPHLDDIVLSCSGRIAKQLGRGESVLVVTVFTGDVEGKKKPRGGIYAQVVDIKGRKAEDGKAMDRLGVDYLWLDYIDSIFRYRNPIFRFGLFIGKSSIEAKLYEAIREDIRKICKRAGNRRLYLPIGAGQHKDHHILFRIGKQIIEQPTNDIEINFYEDVPYVLFPNVLKYRLKLIGITYSSLFLDKDATYMKSIMHEVRELYREIIGVPTLKLGNPLLKPFVFLALILSITFILLQSKYRAREISRWKMSPEIYDVSEVMPEKLAAIMEYRTQLQVPFWDVKDISLYFIKYSNFIGGKVGQYLERYWKMYRSYNSPQ